MDYLSVEEIRRLDEEGLRKYAAFLRKKLVEVVTRQGGHLASNLGIVEISLALVREMDLPREKVVYDTGHQCYVHKMLTGRGEAFETLRAYGGLAGFPRREESEYDAFGTGHSGTGISAALGFSHAARLRGEDGFFVAVIGDGSFTGGMVFEALNNINPDDPVIIILNDNKMSISRSVGRIRSSLNKMRTEQYYRFKSGVEETLENLPVVGQSLSSFAGRVKRAVKRSALPMGNLFEQFGLHYFGPADGNDVFAVQSLIREAKKKKRPAIIHLCTKKGQGYEPALKDPSRFHGISPKSSSAPAVRSNSSLFGECVTAIAEQDPSVVCITAAMEDGVGLGEFAKRFPDRFFDVGIAEEHAMTFGAALAAGGLKPLFAVYSTFYQRAVDSLVHDAALQKLPLVVCLDRAGLSGEDGATHHGVFDLPLTLFIPGVKIYAPLGKKEMEKALTRAFGETRSPSVIRYARGGTPLSVTKAFPMEKDVEYLDFGEGGEVYMVTFGRITAAALEAAERLAEKGNSLRLIRFFALKGFDEKELEEAFRGAKKLLFLEEGCETGGFGQYLKHFLAKRGLFEGPTRILAIGENFVPHGKTELLLEEIGLSSENVEKEWNGLAQT